MRGYTHLRQDRQIALDLLNSNPERSYEEIRYFLEVGRGEPLTENEWDYLMAELDDLSLAIGLSEAPSEFATFDEVFGEGL